MGVRWIKAYFSFIVFFLAERSSENKTSVEAFVIILMDSHHTHTKHKYILIGASKPHCHPPALAKEEALRSVFLFSHETYFKIYYTLTAVFEHVV